MKKIIIFFISIVCLQLAHSDTSSFEEMTVVGRIEGKGSALRVIRSLERDALSGMLQNPQLEETLAKLQKGDEVMIKGYVTYQNSVLEGETRNTPIFVVQSLTPISLSKLGKIEGSKLPDQQFRLTPQKAYSPIGIPVTTQVASAITMTTSMLLLQSLASGPNDIQVTQQLNSGLILFAGAMATGIFIFEQIVHTQNTGATND